MKKILVLLISILSFTQALAQCPTTPITLSTQAEVDAFATTYPGCTVIQDGITISGPDITNLAGLSQIVEVDSNNLGGGLLIIDNPLLVNLNGLENLVSIPDCQGGDLRIQNNVSLTDISALSNLSGEVGWSIIIQDNPQLTSLNGLQNVTNPGCDDLIIWNNDSLTDLSGLEGIVIADDVLIIDNDNLLSLNGLSAFQSTGSFYVRDNDVLPSLDGLVNPSEILTLLIENNPVLTDISALTGVTNNLGGSIIIRDNPSLTSLTGLEGYIEVDEITIDNNDLLTSLNGMQNITNEFLSCCVFIEITNNDLLLDISAFESMNSNSPDSLLISNNPDLALCNNLFVCDYLGNGGSAIINNNAPGCNSVPEVLSSCVATLNRITGKVQYDFNLNGCDPGDYDANSILIEITDGTNTYSTLTDSEGNYSRFLDVDGNLTTSIAAGSLPSFYNVDPISVSTTFSGFGNEDIIDFCIAPNQTVNDLKIVQIPLNDAQPGFLAIYKLVFDNVGTTPQNAQVILTFPDDRQTFFSSSPFPDNISGNQLTWNYSNFFPLESRSITLSFDMFTPPTNEAGDILEFTATIEPVSGDENPDDNVFGLSQIVVNSQDPNDKLVVQGPEILEEQVGDYLDYIVRFENVGTANAVNVRVDDLLSDNLNWNSLRVLSSSHEYEVEILNGNFVSFIFDNIDLPPVSVDPIGGNGYIAFQVRTLDDLVVGDQVENTAEIFFDFNPPIVTNTVVTEVVEELSVPEYNLDNFVRLYPNPAKDLLSVALTDGILLQGVEVYSILGTKLMSSWAETIDVSQLQQAMYFVKVETSRGSIIQKIVKE